MAKKKRLTKEDLIVGKYVEYRNYEFYGHDWYVQDKGPESEPVDHFIMRITAIRPTHFEGTIQKVIKPPPKSLRDVLNRKVGANMSLYYECDMKHVRYLPDDYLGHLLYFK